ncbi:MAG: hypothetical protein IJV22_02615 [Bacteroidales bacterium]|nr:hypothetical protein [Bacteroidales bacterium]
MNQNNSITGLIKHKCFLAFFTLLSIIAICYLLFENNTYSRQISEKDAIIQRLQIRDSISSKLIDIEETDTSFIYSFVRNSDGDILSYHELDSMVRKYDYELYVKDLILVKAKNYYQFNYSIKRIGDTIILGFWNK